MSYYLVGAQYSVNMCQTNEYDWGSIIIISGIRALKLDTFKRIALCCLANWGIPVSFRPVYAVIYDMTPEYREPLIFLYHQIFYCCRFFFPSLNLDWNLGEPLKIESPLLWDSRVYSFIPVRVFETKYHLIRWPWWVAQCDTEFILELWISGKSSVWVSRHQVLLFFCLCAVCSNMLLAN